MSYILILSTAPNQKVARKVAKSLLDQKLVACVNILPKGESHYRWKGKVEKAAEYVLLIKTRKTYFKKVEVALRKVHPYEVPEVIALPIQAGSSDYLSWLAQETKIGH